MFLLIAALSNAPKLSPYYKYNFKRHVNNTARLYVPVDANTNAFVHHYMYMICTVTIMYTRYSIFHS